MLDIKVIRQDPERVKAAMKSRNKDMDKEIDEILEIDVERRAINAAVDNMKAEQNRVSKLIPQYKKEGKDVAPILAEMKELSDKITEDGAKLAELEALGDGKQYLVDLSLTRENPSAAENFGSSNPVQLRS